MKTVEILSPTSRVQEIQEKTVSEIRSLFPNATIEPVGSSAVPIVGREEVDVMLVSVDVDTDARLLEEKGYRKVAFENGIAYLKTKTTQDDVEVTIQVIPSDHSMVVIHRNILEKLRTNDQLRTEYEDFKKSLQGLSKDEYKKRKNEWIKENLLEETGN